MAEETERKSNFIRDIIDKDLASGKHTKIVTRFPPEPNGYLHIGHAKSICLNFGLAIDYQGQCHLRFDDTNPVKEDIEYVESIKNDVKWLGFDWGENLFFASDYFERMYLLAEKLIQKGLAYVDFQPHDAIREQRGTLTEPGVEGPYRNTSPEENLELFRQMRQGKYKDGECILRAKIDMTSPNMVMRDPALYRVKHAHHHNTGDEWCIYPMYDYAHCLEDAFEGVTHSICTLEFENNRELYDWVIQATEVECQPKQIEFARLSLNYTVMSKRKLLQLVQEKHVNGWDDPRMFTIAGLRRRGVTPEAIRNFASLIGVAKANSTVDMSLFEFCVRDDLNHRAPRVMCVIDPIKVTLTNLPEDFSETIDAPLWPFDVPNEGSRDVVLTREIYIERDDFMKDPPKGYYRLKPGGEARLRYGYVIRCDEAIEDESGNVVELKCSIHMDSKDGRGFEGKKVKGVIHWVSATHALPAEIRLYDRLFSHEKPDADGDFLAHINPDSLKISSGFIEPAALALDETHFQFERNGYFVHDLDSKKEAPIFNRVVSLKDSWAKEVAKTDAPEEAPSKPEPKPAATEKAEGTPQKSSRVLEREKAREQDPALAARYAGYLELGVQDDEADLLSGEVEKGDYFEELLKVSRVPASAALWMVNELLPQIEEDALSSLKFTPAQFAELVKLVDDNEVVTAAAREVLQVMLTDGGSPEAIVDQRGLRVLKDTSKLDAIIDQVLAENPDELARYKEGKTTLFGFFIGKVMKATKGAADGHVVRERLQNRLG